MVYILVVHRQQTTFGAFLGKIMDAVVVHSQLGFLVRSGIAGIVFECVVFARHTYGITPRRNDLVGIAFWHGDGIGRGYAHTFKTDQGSAGHAAGGTTS